MKFYGVFGLLILGLLLSGCGQKKNQLENKADSLATFNPAKEIKIGAIFSLTGRDAANNSRGLNGTRLAVENLNRQGGVLGKRIFLQIYDDESSAAGARECAKKAVSDSVIAILGCTYSKIALAAAPIAQSANVPLVVHIATNPAVTEIGDYVFRVCFNNAFQSRLLAKFIIDDLKKRDAAVFFLDDDKYSTDLATEFISAYQTAGGKVIASGSFKSDDVDFAGFLGNIKKLQPSILFIPTYNSQSGMICKQAVKLGLKSIFIGADGWDDGILSYTDSTAQGGYFVDHWDRGITDEPSKKFCAEYATAYGNKNIPNANSALAYDAVYLLADAIKKAGSFDRKKIRLSLQGLNFTGVTGNIRFDKFRNPQKQAVIRKILKNEVVYYKLVKI